MDGVSLGVFSAQGFVGQSIYVWPDQNVVVAFTGSAWTAPPEQHIPSRIMEVFLIPAVLTE